MKAGRELDALVAEKVMGLKIVRAGDLPIWDHQCAAYTPTVVTLLGLERDEFIVMDGDLAANIKKGGCYIAHNSLTRVPNYSGDIAAAWNVMEKLRDRGASVEIGSSNNREGHPWECCVTFKRHTAPNSDIAELAYSAPLAICVAALKIVGVNIDEK